MFFSRIKLIRWNISPAGTGGVVGGVALVPCGAPCPRQRKKSQRRIPESFAS